METTRLLEGHYKKYTAGKLKPRAPAAVEYVAHLQQQQQQQQRRRPFDLEAYLRASELDEDERMETIQIFSLVPPWLVLFAMALLVATFILAIRGRQDPVFTISPYDCQQPALYSNLSSWYLGDWYILHGRGACPVLATGMKTIYIKQGSDIVQETFWTYNFCLNNASQWSQVDDQNAQYGYESGLAADEWRWSGAIAFSLGAIMTLFFCGFLLLLVLSGLATGSGSMTGTGDVSVVGLAAATALLLLFFLQEVAVVALISNTARVDPKAWSTAFFNTCSVKVQRNTGFYFPVLCAACSGVLLLFAGTATCLHGYRTRTTSRLRSPSQWQLQPQPQPQSKVKTKAAVITTDTGMCDDEQRSLR